MYRCYSELITIPTFEERFLYLQMNQSIGIDTFGWDRYLNQAFYNSKAWRDVRRQVIIRDNACDLAFEGHDIMDTRYITVHHINPITKEDVLNRSAVLFDLENLISCSHNTHKAIHYGTESNLIKAPIERHQNDTIPWKR